MNDERKPRKKFKFLDKEKNFCFIDGIPCISRHMISVMFNVADKTVYNWIEKGLPTIINGKINWYDLFGCFDWYLDNVFEGKDKRTAENKKDNAEIRKKVAEAELKELELARARGALIDVNDIEKQLSLRATYFKTALEELPRSNAVEMLNCETEKEVIDFWEQCNQNVLEIFAQRLEIKYKDDFSRNLNQNETEEIKNEPKKIKK
jgi:phage terminase Nu1 subunit (DNA packaging protein)